jgi:hypothetical protein
MVSFLYVNKLGKEGKTINPETMYLILTEQELLEKGHKIMSGLNRLMNSLAGLIEKVRKSCRNWRNDRASKKLQRWW